MEVRKLVGWNIRKLRVERGLTIEELADLAGLASPYLGALERGEKNVGIVALERLAKALGVKFGDLAIEPAAGAKPPKPLSAGRRSKAKPRARTDR